MNKTRAWSRSWYELATVIWLFILAYQWYRFTEPVWKDQTSNLVLYTLIITAAAEFLPIGSILRWLVKLTAIVILHIRLLGIYQIYSSANAYLSGNEKLQSAVELMVPYIWFTIAAWALFELAFRVIDRRGRILLFLGLNLAALTILDSFTPYKLWSETAWVVFAAMGWLVSNHFRRMELNHPRGWKALRRRPLRIFANITFIFAAVLWIGVSVPTISPVLEDPYTLMQKYWNGGNTSKLGEDASGTESGKSGSGSSGATSGYSRDDSNLGGGFQFDSSPVMNVVTDYRAYWRGETREYYTGTGWIDDARENTGPRTVTTGEGVENPEAGTAGKHQITQQITMLNQQKYPVLFGAYSITQVEVPPVADDLEVKPKLIWSGKRATMYWGGFTSSNRGTGTYPRQYTVVSELPEYSEDELRQASYDEVYGSNDEEQSYLQMPSAFPDRVKELARQVAGSSSTPYGKVMLLRDYLRSNFQYTNTPDLSRRTVHDFVDSFLFEIKEGYCDYYSTALVMMARSLDIPARWVKGYAPGQLGSVTDLAEKPVDARTDTTQTYMVTNADAHSWAEVYMGETYGWVPVEATPGFTMPETAPAQEQADEPEEEQQPEAEEENPEADVQQGSMQSDSHLPIAALGWALAGVLVLSAAFAIWRNRTAVYMGLLRLRHGRALTNADKVVAESRRWQLIMKRQGYERAEHETLRETALRWEREQPEIAERLRPLLQQFEQAKYSAESVGDDDWQQTIQLCRQLKDFLRSHKRQQTG